MAEPNWNDRIVDRVLALLDAGDVVRALAIADQTVAGRPFDATARWLRARVLLSMDSVEEAFKEARFSIGLEPGNADAHFLLACAAWRLGRFLKAKASFETALRIASCDGLLLASYSQFLAEQGDLWGAVHTAVRALRLDSLQPTAWAALAEAQLALGRHQEAYRCCRQALSIEASNGYAQAVWENLRACGAN